MGIPRPRRRGVTIAAAATTLLLCEAAAFAPRSNRRRHSSLPTNDGVCDSPGCAVWDNTARIRRNERRITTMAPRALPVSGISECIACASAAEGGGSLLLASSSSAATFAARIEESAPLLSKLLHVPTLWSVLAMSSIVTLLVAWEEAVENVIHNTPKQIKPVIDSMLAEVGGLGFIGLFLSVVVTGGPLGNFIGDISEEFLGDEEL
ncbi:hypothetical protein THAOC_06326, partial [Thalassiosira oceanica]